MIAKLILDKKREGNSLTGAEIREFVNGFTSGEIPDYQMSALAMAICCRGMDERETADLTAAMRDSGRCLSWDFPTADKHSTGGIGDKLSLITQPLAAACGVRVPSLTGRGLGITGGTADKMESIPGYSCAQSLADFQRLVREVGVSLAMQTDEIAPADKRLYALRDVTGTVSSLPLIVSSILSKKLAEGAHTLVFDVKCGSGAFMKTKTEAILLAQALSRGAMAAGRKAAALVTDMSNPLGFAVGNANEVAETLAILEGKAPTGAAISREQELAVELAAKMVSLETECEVSVARERCLQKLADGSALERFELMVAAQGGSIAQFRKMLAKPTFKFCLQSPDSGYIKGIDAQQVGKVALMLEAGRNLSSDIIDPLAGITFSVSVGDKVAAGAPLAILTKASSPDGLEAAAAELAKAFSFSTEVPMLASLALSEWI